MEEWKNEWGAQIITCHGSSNARGVAILIKNGFDCTIHQKILVPLGRFIILKADNQRQNVCFNKCLCTEQRQRSHLIFQ